MSEHSPAQFPAENGEEYMMEQRAIGMETLAKMSEGGAVDLARDHEDEGKDCSSICSCMCTLRSLIKWVELRGYIYASICPKSR